MFVRHSVIPSFRHKTFNNLAHRCAKHSLERKGTIVPLLSSLVYVSIDIYHHSLKGSTSKTEKNYLFLQQNIRCSFYGIEMETIDDLLMSSDVCYFVFGTIAIC